MKQSTVLAKIAAYIQARTSSGFAKTVLPMKYMKRAGIFKASNVDFNPSTGLGHSYDWYELTKKINGVLILNNYHYSPSTCKHMNKVSRVLGALGLKYRTVEAPRGLQDLDAALEHTVREYGAAVVEMKYARKPNTWKLNRFKNGLKTLEKLGKKATKKAIAKAIADAETTRADRNAAAREERAENRLKAKLSNYLETSVCFRDYEIRSKRFFGHVNRPSTVHQVVSADSIESDVQNALHSFKRDGFGSIIFYVDGE